MVDKDTYLLQVEQKLSDWDHRIQVILERAEQRETESDLVRELLRQQQRVERELDEVRRATDEEWERLTGRVGVAAQELQDVLVRTSIRFKLPPPRPASLGT